MNRFLPRLLCLLVTLVAVAALIVLNTVTSGVRDRLPSVKGISAITARDVAAGITTASLQKHLDALAKYPTRMAGTAGSAHAVKHIRETFVRAGLEVLTHPVPLTVPVTQYCQVLDVRGAEIEGVTLRPFWPNVVRTCTIPEPGLEGTAVMAPRGSAFVHSFAGHDPDRTIPLVRTSVAEQWIGLADTGFRAVVFFDDPSVQGRDYMLKELDIPANIPRFLLQGDPDLLDGRAIRIRCRVDWQQVWVDQVVGVLEPLQPPPQREGILVTAHHDSAGWIPDVAPGAEEAGALAGMLALAEFAAGRRGDLKRPMIFVAFAGRGQACAGARWFAHLWGPAGGEAEASARLAREHDARVTEVERYRHLLAMFGEEAYWAIRGDDDAAKRRERSFWREQPDGIGTLMLDEVRALTDQKVHAAQEAMIACDLRRKRRDLAGTALETAYQAARRDVERRRIAATATLLEMKTYHGLDPGGADWLLLKSRVARRRDRSLAGVRRMGQSIQVQRLLHGLDNHFVFSLAYTSGSPTTSIVAYYPETAMRHGARNWFGQIAGQIANDVRPLLPVLVHGDAEGVSPAEAARARGLFINWFDEGGRPYPQPMLDGGSMSYPFTYFYEYLALLAEGRHALTWVTPMDPARRIGTPQDTFDRLDVGNVVVATRVAAAVTTRIAAGHLQLNASEHIARTKQANGRILQAADPSSAVPTRGVPGALVMARQEPQQFVGAVRLEDIAVTDDRGRFVFPPCDSIKPPTDFHAFRIDAATGAIVGVKDMGEAGEGSAPTARRWSNFDNPLRMTLFRCAQTDIYYPLHPLRNIEMGEAFAVDRLTMTAPMSYAVMRGNELVTFWGTVRVYGQGYTLFNPPTTRLYFGIRQPDRVSMNQALRISGMIGSGELPAFGSVGAFLLGEKVASAPPSDDRSVWGPGYLAADTGSIRMWPRQAASAMAAINGHRLARQQRHRVANPVLVRQQDVATGLHRQAEERAAAGDHATALQHALDSVSISMQVYPRIGRTERDAVVAVVMYLFLLIPFSIFLERLLFGFGDIRVQVAAVVLIFAVVFGMLRWMHPAFELVSSGLMVLVGFLTLALSLFVTAFLFVRFQKNLRQLRLRLQRTAEAADVSRLAAAGTAFLLGVNNMRKRKVRTAFTCITLVLLTFALLSLTAVGSEARFRKIAVGKSSYTGLQIRGRHGAALSGTASLQERFGWDFPTSRVVWDEYASQAPSGSIPVSIVHPDDLVTGDHPVARLTKLVGFDPEESEVTPVLDAMLYGRWFKNDSERVCLLPRHAARRLGIGPAQVEAGQVKVWLQRLHLTVIGVFDPAVLDTVRDLDGDSFLPFDVKATRDPDKPDALRPLRLPRLGAREVVLVPARVIPYPGVYRLAVNMNALTSAEAMDEIRGFLQRSRDYVYYGIGGVAYMGRLVQGMHIRGLGAILVPLLIAGGIVFNTMLGSVYERAEEIGVYSAVGLSPTHVHYLFLAEAFVYATIGAVGGYLLAHGLGALLNALDLAGDLAFNYSTLTTVYTTAALFTAVLLSTLYPARKAARLASPSEGTAIQMPEPAGDVMQIELPFTYVELDAVSVIPFLYDVFEDHGEGSSGAFRCQTPQLVGDTAPGASRPGRSHGLEARCWLKPYDLGVSQQVTLSMHASDGSGIWTARMRLQRLSGDISSWRRGNRLFLTVVRRHLLAWRGLEDEQRDEYLVRGLAAMEIPVERFVGNGD